MNGKNKLTLAAKCAPDPTKLQYIAEAGIGAVEIYLNARMLSEPERVIRACEGFPLKYALHAPNDASDMSGFAPLASAIGAEIAILHSIYFDDEWPGIIGPLVAQGIVPTIENVSTILEPFKIMRRYGGAALCLDLEHLQIECSGIYEEEFINIIPRARHVHLTGYVHGSELWHTHIDRGGERSLRMLDMLVRGGYEGWVVSEARTSHQTGEGFKALHEFFSAWRAAS